MCTLRYTILIKESTVLLKCVRVRSPQKVKKIHVSTFHRRASAVAYMVSFNVEKKHGFVFCSPSTIFRFLDFHNSYTKEMR